MDESLRDDTDALSEQRLARTIGIALPLLTISVAAIVGVAVGPATSILVLAAGVLLGVIAILWSSLRILSGDVALSPEIEALDMEAQGVDALASRKKMLLRSLKDLENEHAIGKMEDEDFEQISLTYRSELKNVLQRIDEALAPHRSKAEEAARAHLRKVGLGKDHEAPVAQKTATRAKKAPKVTEAPARLACPKCGESNEPDAKFCKECATKLSADSKTKATPASESEALEDSDDE